MGLVVVVASIVIRSAHETFVVGPCGPELIVLVSGGVIFFVNEKAVHLHCRSLAAVAELVDMDLVLVSQATSIYYSSDTSLSPICMNSESIRLGGPIHFLVIFIVKSSVFEYAFIKNQ